MRPDGPRVIAAGRSRNPCWHDPAGGKAYRPALTASRRRRWRSRREPCTPAPTTPDEPGESWNTTTWRTSLAINPHHSGPGTPTQCPPSQPRQHRRVGYNRTTWHGKNTMTDILIGRSDSTSVTLDPRYGNRQGMIETMSKQMARTAGSQLGRQILRGVLGGIFGGKR